MNKIALVNADDLLGKELREALGRRRELWHDAALLTTDDDSVGALTEIGGRAALVQRLEDDSLEAVDLVFLCGAIARVRPLLATLPPSTAAIILSPDAEADDGEPIVAGINLDRVDRGRPLLSPHAGAIGLAHLLYPLLPYRPWRTAVTLVQPASAIGGAAVDEVLEQTRDILAFRGRPRKAVFGAQIAFNLLPARVEGGAVGRQAAQVLDNNELAIDVQVLQAGVFHSYAISALVQLDDDPGLSEVRAALEAHPAITMVEDPERLGPIDAAARDEVLLGSVQEAGAGGGYWLWAVLDNLTCGGAGNALRIVEALDQPLTH